MTSCNSRSTISKRLLRRWDWLTFHSNAKVTRTTSIQPRFSNTISRLAPNSFNSIWGSPSTSSFLIRSWLSKTHLSISKVGQLSTPCSQSYHAGSTRYSTRKNKKGSSSKRRWQSWVHWHPQNRSKGSNSSLMNRKINRNCYKRRHWS